MLSLDKLYPQLSYARKNGLFDRLNSIYDSLPETTCDRCGTCCTVPPPAYIVEYLNMFGYLRDSLGDRVPDILEKSVRFYFLELADISLRCPFLGGDNLCLVYPVRPLSCRGYGLYGQDGFSGSRNEMDQLAVRYREQYGIILPDEVVNFRLPECGKVKVRNNKKASRETLEVAVSYVAQLESQLFPVDLVDKEYTFVPFVTHLALTVLPEGARLRRPKVLKEYLETGGSPVLDRYAERARSVCL